MKLGSGTLYFGTPEGEMKELCLTSTATIEDATEIIPFVFINTPSEITFEAKVDSRALLTLMTGINVTNNWLKMHGGVMTRKRHLK